MQDEKDKVSQPERFTITAHDIQVFSYSKGLWVNLDCEDMPLTELRQEAKNIALVESNPIRIVKIVTIITTSDDLIESETVNQVGPTLNIGGLCRDEIYRLRSM